MSTSLSDAFNTILEHVGTPVKIVFVDADGCCLDNGKTTARGGIGVYFGPNDAKNLMEPLQGVQTNQRAELT
ncbi:hypothetical protein HDU93_000339, partial [Gonapodya sp. JEL0774]